jgi:hypothetical protein
MIPQVDLFSFVFWKKLKTQKTKHFEINWPLVDTKYKYKFTAFGLDDGFEQNFPRCQLNYLGSFNPTRMFLVIFFFPPKTPRAVTAEEQLPVAAVVASSPVPICLPVRLSLMLRRKKGFFF